MSLTLAFMVDASTLMTLKERLAGKQLRQNWTWVAIRGSPVLPEGKTGLWGLGMAGDAWRRFLWRPWGTTARRGRVTLPALASATLLTPSPHLNIYDPFSSLVCLCSTISNNKAHGSPGMPLDNHQNISPSTEAAYPRRTSSCPPPWVCHRNRRRGTSDPWKRGRTCQGPGSADQII